MEEKSNMYIVIFNVGYTDPEILTNSHGFVEEFSNIEQAKEATEGWLDEGDFRSFEIYEKVSK